MLYSDLATEVGVERDPWPKLTESLRITWLIAWRSTLIWVLALWLVAPVFGFGLTGILQAVGASGHSIVIVVLLILLAMHPAVILPVVLTMLIGKQFRGFDVVVERTDGSVSDLSFGEALAPAWLLYWRGIVVTIIGQILLGVILRLFRPVDFASAYFDKVVVIWIGIALIAFWLIVQSMFAKRFKLFRFVVRRQVSHAVH